MAMVIKFCPENRLHVKLNTTSGNATAMHTSITVNEIRQGQTSYSEVLLKFMSQNLQTKIVTTTKQQRKQMTD